MEARTQPRVAVVGVGSIGAMALWQLSRRGIAAVGYDSYAPGHDRGAAGGESRIFRTAYQEGAAYVPLLREALDSWGDLERASGRRLLHRSGCATVGPREDPKVLAVQEAARLHGIDVEVLTGDEARRRVPEHPVGEGQVLVLDPLGGLIRPEASVIAAVALAEASGAEVRRNTPVLDVRDEGDVATVHTADGVETYDRVVVAPGPWAKRLPLFDGFTLVPKQITPIWFLRRDSDQFVLDRTPVTIRVGGPAFSCFPSVDGASVKVIAHGYFSDLDDPECLPRSAPREVVERAVDAVRRALPGLAPDPVRVSTYSDVFTEDEHALLGPLRPDGPVVVAAGFSGHGFKLAPVFGRLACDFALTGSTDHDISFLNPARLAGTTTS